MRFRFTTKLSFQQNGKELMVAQSIRSSQWMRQALRHFEQFAHFTFQQFAHFTTLPWACFAFLLFAHFAIPSIIWCLAWSEQNNWPCPIYLKRIIPYLKIAHKSSFCSWRREKSFKRHKSYPHIEHSHCVSCNVPSLTLFVAKYIAKLKNALWLH